MTYIIIAMACTLRYSLLVFCCALISLLAQTNTGTFRGYITDPSGIAVAGAKATARNTNTGVLYSAASNDAGLFVITEVPAGQYSVTVEKAGFRRYVQAAATMTTGESVSLDVKLTIGDVSESVTVSAETPQVESTTSQFDQLIESKSIEDLPLADRRTMNVIQLSAAAVFTGYDNGQKPNFSLAGGRAQSQMYWIDGGSGQNMRLGIGQVDIDPPVDLVDEIKVLSNNYAAEYGGSAGGVIIETTKSGTNQLRGSLYEFFRNDKLDAPGYFAPVMNGAKVKPELRYNVYGVTAGAPIRRNKTFIFGAFEGQQRRTGYSQTLTVPTLRQRSADFSQTFTAAGKPIPIYDPNTNLTSGSTVTRQQFPNNVIPTSRLDPVALKILDYYPLPNRAAANLGGGNNYSSNGVNTLAHVFYSLKVDHTFSTKDRITGRYLYNRDNTNVVSVFPTRGPDATTFNDAHAASFLLDYTRTISPTVVNDARFNIGRRYAHALTAGVGGDYDQKLGIAGLTGNAFPQIVVTGLTTLGSAGQERRQYPIDQQQYVDNLSVVRGQHALKAGFEARRSRNYEVNLPTASGAFTFATTPTGLPGNSATGFGLASLLLGFPTGFSTQTTDVLDRHSWYLAGFAQDDWSITRSLTLNLGVRWETDTAIRDANNRGNGFDQNQINPVSGTPGVVKFFGVNGFRTTPYATDWNNFAPRLGFAWKVRGSEKTVLRGGYGIFYAHPFDAGVPNAVALGFSVQSTLNSPDNGLTAPFYLRNGVPSTGAAKPVLNDSYGAVRVGQNPNTAVTFFETNRKTGYSQQFNFGVQRQLTGSLVVEATVLGNLSRKLPSANLSIDQIDPSILGTAHQSQKDRPYPQFSNVSIQNPTLGVSNYYAGLVRAEKRYSHGLNLIASYTYSKFLENTNDTGTTLGADGGAYSNYYNRRADYGPSTNDVRHRVSFSSIYELPLGTGHQFLGGGVVGKIVGGLGLGNLTVFQTGAPFTVVTQTNNTQAFSAGAQRADVSGNPNLGSDQRMVARWFDTSVFSQPAIFHFGNEGRNVLRAPGLFTMDFSLRRNFALTERVRLQFRGEFFNALNHTNFSVPGRTFGSADFGVISGAGPARQIQVGARLEF
jgi:hypothetical protein